MRPLDVLVAFLAVLVLGTVTACESQPEPVFADPTSPAVSSDPPTSEPTATSSPTEPTVDPAEETAKQFIRRFQDAALVMQNSGETGPYLALTSGCVSCDSLATAVEATYGSGGSADTGGSAVRRLKKVGESGRFEVLEYDLVSQSTTIYAADGSVEERFPGGTERFQVTIGRASGAWRVVRLVRR